MWNFVNGLLVLICAVMIGISVVGGKWLMAFVYLVALLFFYRTLEASVFRD